MAELMLYTNPMSRGRIARLRLEEVGEPYRTKIVAFGPSMHAPDYLAINPMGKVPALKHGDTIVTECAAICAYLADTFPKAGLAPTAEERGAYYRWMFFAAGPLEAAVTNRSLGVEAAADRRRMVGYGSFGAVMNALEQAVSDNPYIAGDRFTAADVYLGSQIGWGLQFGTIDKRPIFEAYYSRLAGRPAWQRAKSLDDAAMADMPRTGR